MHYSKIVGVCQTIGSLTRLEGIGDEPMMPVSDGSVMLMHKPHGTSLKGAKIDQHASFPKGLPRAFRIDDHIRD